jgi:hypothetical protein
VKPVDLSFRPEVECDIEQSCVDEVGEQLTSDSQRFEIQSAISPLPFGIFFFDVDEV